jgi:hypothetical protein
VGRPPAVMGGGPVDPKMGEAGKATDPKFRDSRVAEVRITGPDYCGVIKKGDPVLHF